MALNFKMYPKNKIVKHVEEYRKSRTMIGNTQQWWLSSWAFWFIFVLSKG